METRICEVCGREATYSDSVTDRNLRGSNINECGYRTGYFCYVHATERKANSENRVQKLVIKEDEDDYDFPEGSIY